MVEINRKVAIAIVSALLIAGGGTAVVLGGGGDGGIEPDGSSTPSNAITDVAVTSEDLEVSVKQGSVTEVALLQDGSEIESSGEIGAAETVATMDAADLTPGQYRLIGYGEDGEVVANQSWQPEVSLSVDTAERITSRSNKAGLRVDISNTGEVPLSVESVYVSGGFPTDVHGKETLGEATQTAAVSQGLAVGSTETFRMDVGTGARPETLTPPERTCDGEDHPLSVTVELAEATDREIDMTATLGGEATESRYVSAETYCTDTTITVDDIETVDT